MHWSDKFLKHEVNYDDILKYKKNEVYLTSIGKIVCAPELVVGNSIYNIQNAFLENFEILNINLLKYIPGQSDGKWCIFHSLLEDYNVYLPKTIRDIIVNKISFPGQNLIPQEHLLHLCSSTNGLFKPGHDIALSLHKSLTLRELEELVDELDSFQQPLLAHLDMIVFFKLHVSILFDKYIRYYLKKIAGHQHEPQLYQQMSNLVEALSDTYALVCKIVFGTANYSEIVADDEKVLQAIDIEQELSILYDYVQSYKLIGKSCVELDGVRSLLELFQYTTHIVNIDRVCNQYKTLEGCSNDPSLKQLLAITEESMDRSKLTLKEAKIKLTLVKNILRMEDSKCLDIFSVMSDSADFYKFVWDKRFYDQKGQKMFTQEYELITAQLQHEEYNEVVLNHLLVAFKIIILFMDSKKNFSELMSNVSRLNATHGFKQFATVNANITLIRLWFSRAEVRVLSLCVYACVL